MSLFRFLLVVTSLSDRHVMLAIASEALKRAAEAARRRHARRSRTGAPNDLAGDSDDLAGEFGDYGRVLLGRGRGGSL